MRANVASAAAGVATAELLASICRYPAGKAAAIEAGAGDAVVELTRAHPGDPRVQAACLPLLSSLVQGDGWHPEDGYAAACLGVVGALQALGTDPAVALHGIRALEGIAAVGALEAILAASAPSPVVGALLAQGQAHPETAEAALRLNRPNNSTVTTKARA